MPWNAVSLGTRLAGRYRLELELRGDSGMARWAAIDELLNRGVGVSSLPGELPHAAAVMSAARRAAQLNDPRFVRILDAGEDDGHVWVVSEWVDAPSLADLVALEPIGSREAGRISLQVAEGLAAAHAAGLAHRSLRPEHVLRTDTGAVKIVGLEVAAAAAPADAGGREPAELDAAACGAVLYAALTGRWPLEDVTTLPPAPTADGLPCSPRQVRAGVPTALDEITCSALQASRKRDIAALTTPAEVAAALRRARAGGLDDTGPLPLVRGASAADDAAVGDDDGPSRFAASEAPGRAARGIRIAATVVLAVGLGLAAWQLLVALGGSPAADTRPQRPAASAGPSPSATQGEPTGAVLAPVAVDDFDPPPGNGEENPEDRGLAVDGDPRTAWRTKTYFRNPEMGGQKRGVGLLVDLGRARSISAVTLQLEGRGTRLEIRAAERRSADLDGYAVVARSADTGPFITLPLDPATTARYVLLWLTRLPTADSDSRYRGGVAELVVRG